MGNVDFESLVGKQTIVSPFLFKADDTFEDERFMRVRIAVCHTGLNLNGSSISKEVLENAASSLSNIPVLANIVQKEDGTYDFHGHDMSSKQDSEGNYYTYYIEKPVGVIPESNNYEIKFDEESDRYYIYATAYLYREYGNETCSIIDNRGGKTDVSCEIWCNEISYNAKEKYMNIDDFTFTGVTLLGADVKPAMTGANATVFQLDEKAQSDTTEDLANIMKELTIALNKFNDINNGKQEGGSKLFEQLLEKYSKTKEDITFEYENMSDDELIAKFAELFEEQEDGSKGEGEEDEVVEEEGEGEDGDSSDGDGDDDGNGDGDEGEGSEIPEQEACKKKKKCSVDEEGNMELTFKLSHEDVRTALYNLIGQYEELDNDYYFIESVYDDSFVMQGYFTGNYYGQKYSKDGDNVSLEGERYALHAEFLTDSELASLNDMRENYSALMAMKNEKDKEEKNSLLNSESYDVIRETEEFQALVANAESMSIEEIEEKADMYLGRFAKHGKFSVKEEKQNKAKLQFGLGEDSQEKSTYKSLFEEFKKNKTII